MMSLTFGLFTQVSGSGPLGPLVLLSTCILGPFFSVMLFHLKNYCFLRTSFKADTFNIPGCHTSFKPLVNNFLLQFISW